MALGLEKSAILYLRRLERFAAVQQEEVLNNLLAHEFDIPGSQRFNPEFFPGFLNDPTPSVPTS